MFLISIASWHVSDFKSSFIVCYIYKYRLAIASVECCCLDNCNSPFWFCNSHSKSGIPSDCMTPSNFKFQKLFAFPSYLLYYFLAASSLMLPLNQILCPSWPPMNGGNCFSNSNISCRNGNPLPPFYKLFVPERSFWLLLHSTQEIF